MALHQAIFSSSYPRVRSCSSLLCTSNFIKYKDVLHYFCQNAASTQLVYTNSCRFFGRQDWLTSHQPICLDKHFYIIHTNTYLTNMQMPVFSIALDIPFHDASMEYFCFAVSGRRGSVAGGGPSDSAGGLFTRRSDAASLPNWQPMVYHKGMLFDHSYTLFSLTKRHFTFQIIFVTFVVRSLLTH